MVQAGSWERAFISALCETGVRRKRCAARGRPWRKKVAAHFKRLRKPLRVEGMMMWRAVALATREAGIPVQSGTVPVERLWSCLSSMLPSGAQCISIRWFNVLSNLMFLRYTMRHVAARSMLGVAEGDALVPQRLQVHTLLAQAASEPEGGDAGIWLPCLIPSSNCEVILHRVQGCSSVLFIVLRPCRRGCGRFDASSIPWLWP